MRSFDYASPSRLEEVVALMQEQRATRPLAGGTDLLTLVKADVYHPQRLVNIKALPDMSGIDYDPARGLWLGGLTTLADVETSEVVRDRYPAIVQALELAATPQLRNMATVAGNLLQRPRCWYFRTSRIDCWLKGGDDCPLEDGESRFGAIFAQSPCWAVHPSDLAPVLVMLDAEVRTRGPQGDSATQVADFLQPPSAARRTETLLASDELVTAIRVPPPPDGMRMVYLKAMDRSIWAFALVSVSAALQLRDSRVSEARIVLGGVANVPVRALAAEEALIGAEIQPALIDRAADAAVADAQPLAGNGYKRPLTRALVRRALEQLVAA